MAEEIKAAYLGEALLLRWGESASQGRTVTLQLDEEGQTHPFKGFKAGGNGQRMKLCVVLIDDHEQPQEPDRARRSGPKVVAVKPAGDAEAHKERTPKKRSSLAYLMCQDKEFRAWLHEQAVKAGFGITMSMAANREDLADIELKSLIAIHSKQELDTDPHAAARFDALRTDFEIRGMVR